MRGYSALHTFTADEQRILVRARRIVETFPETITHATMGRSAWVRCHEAARAVGRLLNLDVQDGHYGVVDHSWCRIERPGTTAYRVSYTVLDVYAVGQLPPVQLISPVAGLHEYKLDAPRTDIDERVVEALVKLGRRALGKGA
jgi:hypothetical protein